MVRTFVRFSRHFSVNEPRVAGEPSWSTRAARDPHYRLAASRDLTPHCSRGGDYVRSVGPRFIPTGRTRSSTTRLTSGFPRSRPPPPLVPSVIAATTPSILRTHLRPVRLILLVPLSPSPPSLHLVHPPDVPFASLLPHRHLQPSPRSTPPAYSFSFSLFLPLLFLHPFPHPFPIAQCRNMYDGTPSLLTSQVSALGCTRERTKKPS